MPTPQPIETVRIDATDEQLAEVRFDANGLVPAIAQDIETKEVLMVAWMNAETLRMTFAEGRMVYWSRSRKEVWRKGDTSGDRQFVREAYYDCDADVLLFKVAQEGKGACHTGAYSCFFRRFGASGASAGDRASASEPGADGVPGAQPPSGVGTEAAGA